MPGPVKVPYRRRALLLAVTCALAIGSCTSGEKHGEVVLTMDEYEMTVEPTTAEAGRVTIFVDNDGTEEHTVLFAFAARAEELPTAPDGSVDTSALNVIDELEPVGPGRFRIEPLLRAGTLVLFCDLVTEGADGQPVSHFQQGMWTVLEITGDAGEARR